MNLRLRLIVAFFLLQTSRNDALETQAVAGAASSVAESAGNASEAVVDAVTPGK